ncbi:nuclear transport factor 2 family protein [Saccharothrix deserti]|uniref:nuclear transport factor 2 family protein n=1 Tax=Saccharothrix deserti TaxID=2593674 RepID=UPI00131CD90B|nr:nuclear transport factor 2 family protein [Saccharothrix deserti]
MTADLVRLVHDYMEANNERDHARRRAIIDRVFTEDGSYIDDALPEATVGRDALDKQMAYFHENFPEHIFTLVGIISVHHDMALFTWKWGAPGAAGSAASGTDAVLFENGRIKRVLGFLN